MDAVDCLKVMQRRAMMMGELKVELWTELWISQFSKKCRITMNELNEDENELNKLHKL